MTNIFANVKTAKKIWQLITTPGKASPVMTHALKKLGNGSMEDGLRRVVVDAFKVGGIGGIAIGTVSGVVGSDIVRKLTRKVKEDIKGAQAEGELILDALQQSIPKDTEDLQGPSKDRSDKSDMPSDQVDDVDDDRDGPDDEQ